MASAVEFKVVMQWCTRSYRTYSRSAVPVDSLRSVEEKDHREQDKAYGRIILWPVKMGGWSADGKVAAPFSQASIL